MSKQASEYLTEGTLWVSPDLFPAGNIEEISRLNSTQTINQLIDGEWSHTDLPVVQYIYQLDDGNELTVSAATDLINESEQLARSLAGAFAGLPIEFRNYRDLAYDIVIVSNSDQYYSPYTPGKHSYVWDESLVKARDELGFVEEQFIFLAPYQWDEEAWNNAVRADSPKAISSWAADNPGSADLKESVVPLLAIMHWETTDHLSSDVLSFLQQSIDYAENRYKYLAPNLFGIAYDELTTNRNWLDAPTIEIDPGVFQTRAALIKGESTTITFRLSQPSQDFELDDLHVDGGIITDFSGSGLNYTAKFIPNDNTITTGSVKILSNSFSNELGIQNPIDVITEIAIDTTGSNHLTEGTVYKSPNQIPSWPVSVSLVDVLEANLIFSYPDSPSPYTQWLEGHAFTGEEHVYRLDDNSLASIYTEVHSSFDRNELTRVTAEALSRIPKELRGPSDYNIVIMNEAFMHGHGGYATDGTIVLSATESNGSYEHYEELLAHEIAHLTLAWIINQERDAWIEARDQDKDRWISSYAYKNPLSEDIPETITPWLAIMHHLDPSQLTADDRIYLRDSLDFAQNRYKFLAGNVFDIHNFREYLEERSWLFSPFATISSDDSSLTQGESALITFNLSEASDDFTLDSIQATGGSLDDFQGEADSYQAVFTPDDDSNQIGSVKILSNSFSNESGKTNTNQQGLQLYIDTTNENYLTDGTLWVSPDLFTSGHIEAISHQNSTVNINKFVDGEWEPIDLPTIQYLYRLNDGSEITVSAASDLINDTSLLSRSVAEAFAGLPLDFRSYRNLEFDIVIVSDESQFYRSPAPGRHTYVWDESLAKARSDRGFLEEQFIFLAPYHWNEHEWERAVQADSPKAISKWALSNPGYIDLLETVVPFLAIAHYVNQDEMPQEVTEFLTQSLQYSNHRYDHIAETVFDYTSFDDLLLSRDWLQPQASDSVPTVDIIEVNEPSSTSDDLVEIKFLLSAESHDFDIDDVRVDGGELHEFNGSGKQYSAKFLPSSTTDHITITIPAQSFSDSAGQTNPESTHTIEIRNPADHTEQATLLPHDMDANGDINPFTDGLILATAACAIEVAAGIRAAPDSFNDSLMDAVIHPGADRSTPSAIKAHLTTAIGSSALETNNNGILDLEDAEVMIRSAMGTYPGVALSSDLAKSALSLGSSSPLNLEQQIQVIEQTGWLG